MRIFVSAINKIIVAIILFIFIRSESMLITIAQKNPTKLVYLIVSIAMVGVIFLNLLFSTKLTIINIKNMRLSWKDLKNSFSWLLLIIGVKLIGGIILTFENTDTTYNQVGLESFLTGVPIFIIALFTIVSAPIMEEILFREFLLKLCFKDYLLIGVLVSSILFGMAHHPTNFGSFVTYTGMGLVLGTYYKKYRRLELTMLLHFLNNLVGLLPFIYHSFF